ncbi:MAG: biotin/lipoate A/B protein ligase family protein [Candidatus Nanohalobium sp.]
MTRFIPFTRYDPYFKTGLNRALMESVRESGEKVIFLAGWKKDCVNIGYSQKISEEIDEEVANERGLDIVRRQGGGGTTYLTRDGEITWGIVAQEEKFPDDVNRIYELVCGEIAEGLSRIGIEAEHEPINDIVTGGGKISGATLKREDGVVYIGGTLIYDTSPEEMFQVLTPGKEKIADKKIEKFEDRVTSVKKESDASFDEAIEALRKGLLKDENYTESELTDEERSRAQGLADKYSSKEWVYRE